MLQGKTSVKRAYKSCIPFFPIEMLRRKKNYKRKKSTNSFAHSQSSCIAEGLPPRASEKVLHVFLLTNGCASYGLRGNEKMDRKSCVGASKDVVSFDTHQPSISYDEWRCG
ncbi:hypothetical protein TNCV_4954311 [Trichonephila clavipes]|nr:hypothetical protein TNCV_4954311 [Trichonephila clavipes]